MNSILTLQKCYQNEYAMWILLVVTTLTVDPPSYDFYPRNTVKTMSECMKLLETISKQELSNNKQFYCIKAKG
jgi:hypothetical protein